MKDQKKNKKIKMFITTIINGQYRPLNGKNRNQPNENVSIIIIIIINNNTETRKKQQQEKNPKLLFLIRKKQVKKKFWWYAKKNVKNTLGFSIQEKKVKRITTLICENYDETSTRIRIKEWEIAPFSLCSSSYSVFISLCKT